MNGVMNPFSRVTNSCIVSYERIMVDHLCLWDAVTITIHDVATAYSPHLKTVLESLILVFVSLLLFHPTPGG